MGLTLFVYLAAAVMALSALSVKRSGRDAAFFRLAALASVGYSLAIATGYLLAADHGGAALALVRWATVAAIVAYLAFFRIALTYPYGRRLIPVDLVLAAAAGLVAWQVAFTDAYIVQVRRVALEFIRFEGERYALFSLGGAALGLASAVVMAARGLRLKSRVYRQQLLVMAAGLAGHVAWGYLIVVLLPLRNMSSIYPLAAANGLVSILAASYAMRATRVFHPGTVALRILSALFMFALFALPLGLVAGVLFLFRGSMPGTVAAIAAALFVAAGRMADSFAGRRLGAARDEEAREELEAAIAHIDLSAGRDTALGELSVIMGNFFSSSWFQVLCEGEKGGLARIFPDEASEPAVRADSPVMEALAGLESRVVLKTDVVANPAFADRKAALLSFFDATGAEALVLAKEGRRIVGIFALGPKLSGADYDDLDYAAFDAAHGKLFVLAYYARHVARESLLETVEKEIGLADQIVRSIQEHVDPIVHPGVDASFLCKSTRQLGGDIYDSVRLSEHRWFFVVGDVSGKGLNASMSMVILKSMIRTLLKEEKDFVRLVARTNAFIKERLPRGTFFAGVFGFVALDKGSVYFINCGIPAMLFRSPSLDSIIEVQGEGKMLGFVKDVEPYLKTRKLALPPGSSLFISTDGIIEAESVRGERYGKERLVRVLAENAKASAKDTIDAVVRSASSFTDNNLDDDLTLVALRYGAKPAAGQAAKPAAKPAARPVAAKPAAARPAAPAPTTETAKEKRT